MTIWEAAILAVIVVALTSGGVMAAWVLAEDWTNHSRDAGL